MALIMACALLAYLVSMVALYVGIEVVRPLNMPAPLESTPSEEMMELYYELSSKTSTSSEYNLGCESEMSVTETLSLMAETLAFEDVVEMGFSFELDRSTFVLSIPPEHPWALN